MGFYSPATLVKDAQRHGLKIRPIDVLRSDWLCTLEAGGSREPILRMGLRYVRGLREEAAKEIMTARTHRAFDSVDDLLRRVPALRRDELVTLAQVGALNHLQSHCPDLHLKDARMHRRDVAISLRRSASRRRLAPRPCWARSRPASSPSRPC